MKETPSFAFFAAANGYSGFRSYFDEIFNPMEYTEIYILKGGPGTGKSTIMKSIYSNFKETATHSEAIYCSSDNSSLDGVILEFEDKRIAVLDGTSPHERDAYFPGAIDEIINLGTGWDRRWLQAKRDIILPLSKEKRDAYKTAYSYLSEAGGAHMKSAILNSGYFDTKSAKKHIKKLAEKLTSTTKIQRRTRLISAFGRGGYTRFDTLKSISDDYIGVRGAEHAVRNFIELMWDFSKDRYNTVRFPSPLDGSATEAIYFPDSKLSLVADNTAQSSIYADEYYKPEKLDNERSRLFSDTEALYLAEAVRWFNIAYDLHSRLEKIYSEAMNFENNDRLLARLKEEISEKIRS